MKIFNSLLLTIMVYSMLGSSIKTQQNDYPIKPVPFTKVKIQDKFWAPRLKINTDVTIPIAFQKSEETGRIKNFKIAAKMIPGKFCTIYPFDDSDVFKNMEAAAYSLQVFPDPKLVAYLDSLIDYIGKAQEPDGYIYTNRTIDPENPHEWSGKQRWEKEEENSHELYNIGHMYESAVAHYQATGKRNFLDIAIKNANLIDKEFGWGKIEKAPGHQVIEMGLVKLYRVTGDDRYLKLAKFFIDCRGPNKGEYAQMHKKFVDQDEAVGHAVRAGYLYSGATDVAALTGDGAYLNALNKIWEDVVYRKMYVTGGTGAAGGWEGFGKPYELPNLSAYCETCASISDVFWNHRMFLLYGDSKYYDVLERVLYNALLSGVSLKGDRFFYPNPLASIGQHERAAWFGCACCPVNISRLIPSVPGYVYATKDDNLFVNLFVESTADINLLNNKILVEQKTEYPWNGKITVELNPENENRFEVLLRIPGWAKDQPIPGDLYSFKDKFTNGIKLFVNGKEEKYELKKGYASLNRVWKKGDKITLDLPMPVRKVIAHPKIAADQNRVSLQKGPIVFCAEWIDNPNKSVMNILVDDDSKLTSEFRKDLLGGVQVIKGKVKASFKTNDDKINIKIQDFLAIPYCTWANRGRGEMAVWFASKSEASHPTPNSTIANTSKVSASHKTKDLSAINDQYEPSHSNDHDISYYHWWPKKDTTEWLQYDFKKEEEISLVRVYWFDDGPEGGCRIPASWKILYNKDKKWIPVNNLSDYIIEKDKWNEVRFDKIKTNALRLEVQLPKEFASGIYEWIVK